MKKSAFYTICIVSLFLLTAFTSCEKEAVNEKPEVDKEAYFTISFNSKVYTAYGYHDNASTTPYDGPSVRQTTTLDSSGNLVAQATLYSRDLYLPSSYSDPLSLGNCELALTMHRDNLDFLGLYTVFSNYYTPGINIGTGEGIFFNPTGCRLTLDRIVEHHTTRAEMVEGTISCLIFTSASGMVTYPATGNFRMYLTY